MPDIFDASKDKTTSSNSKSVFNDEPMTQAEPENNTEPVITAESESSLEPEINTEPVFDDVIPPVKKRRPPLEAVNDYSAVMRGEQPSGNPFGAFSPKPLSVHSFDSQLDGENVLLLLRMHPITQIGKILAIILMIIFPMFFGQVDFYTQLGANYQTAIVLFWYLITMGFALESFLVWFYNVYIVTDERIIDIDFLSLIYRNVAAAKIDKIEDITAITSGALQSVFDYGTVQIQTAAERTEFEFEAVPQPNKVTQFLNEMLEEEEREKLEGRVR